MRRCGVLCILALAFACAPAAFAGRGSLDALPEVGRSAHFSLHAPAGSIGADDVARKLDQAERAYAAVEGAGFWPPVDDGDGHVDIYLAPDKGYETYAQPDGGPLATSGSIVVGPYGSYGEPTVAHELFHVLQYAVTQQMSGLVQEGTASWLQSRLYPGSLGGLRPAPLVEPLDCGLGCNARSGPSPYARYAFFAYLARAYGDGVIAEILQAHAPFVARGEAVAAVLDPMRVIGAVLAAHGSSAAEAYARYAFRQAPGNEPGNVLLPAAGRPATAALPVERWASRVVWLSGGRGCARLTLDVAVAAPAGSGLRVALVDGPTATELPLSGGRVSFRACGSGLPLVLANTGDAVTPAVTVTLVSRRAVAAAKRGG